MSTQWFLAADPSVIDAVRDLEAIGVFDPALRLAEITLDPHAGLAVVDDTKRPVRAYLADAPMAPDKVVMVVVDAPGAVGGSGAPDFGNAMVGLLDRWFDAGMDLEGAIGQGKVAILHLVAPRKISPEPVASSPGFITVVLSPLDRHSPQSVATGIESGRWPVHVASGIAALCGWWVGATSGAFDGLRRGPTVSVATTYARGVSAPGPVGVVVEDIVSGATPAGEPAVLIPPLKFEPADEIRSKAMIDTEEARAVAELGLALRPPPMRRKAPKEIHWLEALERLVRDLVRRIIEWPERTLERVIAANLRWARQLVEMIPVDPDEKVVLFRSAGGIAGVDPPLELPPTDRIEEFVSRIIRRPTPSEVDGPVDALAAGVVALVDGSPGPATKGDAWDKAATISDPEFIARDPLRWIDTETAAVDAHRSDWELWLREHLTEVLGLLDDKAQLKPDPSRIDVVIDVPPGAHRSVGSWAAGQCRQSIDPTGALVSAYLLIHPSACDDPIESLETLAHEAIHAALPGAGHGEAFQDAASAIGLDVVELAGAGVTTAPGEGFKAWARQIIDQGNVPEPPVRPLLERLHLRASAAASDAWQGMRAAVERLRGAMEERDVPSGGGAASDRSPAWSPWAAVKAIGRFIRRLLNPLRLVRVALVLIMTVGVLALVVFFPPALIVVIPWLVWKLVRGLAALVMRGRRLEIERRKHLEDPVGDIRREVEHLASEALRLRRFTDRLDPLSRSLGLLVHHPFGLATPIAPDLAGELVVDSPRSLKVRRAVIDERSHVRLHRESTRAVFSQGWLTALLGATSARFSAWHTEQDPDLTVPQFPGSDEAFAYLIRGDVSRWLRGELVSNVVATAEESSAPVEFVTAPAEKNAHSAEKVASFLAELLVDSNAVNPDLELWDVVNVSGIGTHHSAHVYRARESTALGAPDLSPDPVATVHLLALSPLGDPERFVDMVSRVDLWSDFSPGEVKAVLREGFDLAESSEDAGVPEEPQSR